mmetsp:Transcript_64545/g.179072  ORF Transcript_64545/g.179072 Transcript_64545/m.179072 type:complete len:202 (-) Transcript_64545:24-629(-)
MVRPSTHVSTRTAKRTWPPRSEGSGRKTISSLVSFVGTGTGHSVPPAWSRRMMSDCASRMASLPGLDSTPLWILRVYWQSNGMISGLGVRRVTLVVAEGGGVTRARGQRVPRSSRTYPDAARRRHEIIHVVVAVELAQRLGRLEAPVLEKQLRRQRLVDGRLERLAQLLLLGGSHLLGGRGSGSRCASLLRVEKPANLTCE